MSTALEHDGRSAHAAGPTWAEVDLAAFRRNVAEVRRRLPARSRLVAVLKADGYGHGAVELARCCDPGDVAMIATARLVEALALREAGIVLPILNLGVLNDDQIVEAVQHEITIGIVGPDDLERAARVARASERELVVHLKLDSGMGRMGVIEPELPRVVDILRGAPALRVDALYTHFANASDPADPFTAVQIASFDRLVVALRDAGISPAIHHLANSAALMRGLVRPGDYVRAGIVLYGSEPLEAGASRLEPILRWRTEIVRLKDLPAGRPVGYGGTFRTARPSRIATLPVGYADGYDRRLSNRAEVLVRGRRAPVVGRVSMDLTTIDVTDVPGVTTGDEVVLIGRQEGDEISAEELAARSETISYEVFCRISARVPRVYK
ncbi:MAG TPA: alanine racemase [Thermoanaerobaculia bacterium]|nr:alanine racemase [Thermoanaerobaculia bacterium]